MPNQTTNYNLTKPLETERYDVQVFNNNADIIDTQMKSNADSIANVNSRLDNLNNWTTVEFTLADFLHNEESGVTYLRVEAPSGYEIAEIKGCFTVSKREADTSTTTTVIDMTTLEYSSEMDGTLCSNSHSTSTRGFSTILSANINVDLSYCQSELVFATSSTSFSPTSSPTLTNSATRGKLLNQSKFETTSFTLKTNIPNSNILYFFGKLQYRVVPAS